MQAQYKARQAVIQQNVHQSVMDTLNPPKRALGWDGGGTEGPAIPMPGPEGFGISRPPAYLRKGGMGAPLGVKPVAPVAPAASPPPKLSVRREVRRDDEPFAEMVEQQNAWRAKMDALDPPSKLSGGQREKKGWLAEIRSRRAIRRASRLDDEHFAAMYPAPTKLSGWQRVKNWWQEDTQVWTNPKPSNVVTQAATAGAHTTGSGEVVATPQGMVIPHDPTKGSSAKVTSNAQEQVAKARSGTRKKAGAPMVLKEGSPIAKYEEGSKLGAMWESMPTWGKAIGGVALAGLAIGAMNSHRRRDRN